jgi:hypothetical protein
MEKIDECETTYDKSVNNEIYFTYDGVQYVAFRQVKPVIVGDCIFINLQDLYGEIAVRDVEIHGLSSSTLHLFNGDSVVISDERGIDGPEFKQYLFNRRYLGFFLQQRKF